MISFEHSKKDRDLIGRIVDRAMAMARRHKLPILDMKHPAQSLDMDITACHCNGTPLRLDELADADDTNFGHDVWGIHRYMDRETGHLTNCFVPRFARRHKTT